MLLFGLFIFPGETVCYDSDSSSIVYSSLLSSSPCFIWMISFTTPCFSFFLSHRVPSIFVWPIGKLFSLSLTVSPMKLSVTKALSYALNYKWFGFSSNYILNLSFQVAFSPARFLTVVLNVCLSLYSKQIYGSYSENWL